MRKAYRRRVGNALPRALVEPRRGGTEQTRTDNPAMRLSIIGTLASLGLAAAITGASAESELANGSPRHACFARPMAHSTAEQAIRAGIRAAIKADPIVEVQGRRYRRTTEGMEQDLLAAVKAGTRLSPAWLRFHKEAVRRCGRETNATRAAWAVVFHESHSVMCCNTWTIFVVRDRRGWLSY
jgi:hypothetical protein